MIKEISSFIATKAGLTIGTDLYCGHRPQDAADNCDVVLETAGGSIYPDLPDRVDKAVQIISRGTTYFTARTRAWAIYDAIYRNHTKGSSGWTLPNVTGDEYVAMVIEPSSDPVYIGQDDKGRYEFSINFQFKIRSK